MNLIEQESNDITKIIKKKCVNETCCGIYGLRCKTTNKWYVGQSKNIDSRWSEYKRNKTKKQPKLHNAMTKYGYDGFDKILIEYCDNIDWILDYREMFWIRTLDSIKNGYNIREGGNTSKISEETKVKLRNLNLGKKMSPETLEKMRARPHHTPEAREKMSNAARNRTRKKGYKLSPAARLRQSEAKTLWWKNKKAAA
jgi:group I intron endonuclease